MAPVAAAGLLSVLALLPSVFGLLFEPAATLKNPGNVLEISADIDPAFRNKTWSSNASINTQVFAEALPWSNFTNLRDIADRLSFECSDVRLRNEPMDVRKMNSIRLKHNGTAHGPCEMWLNDARVFNATDCATDESGRSKLFPVPYAACHGVCAFSTYWLLLDEPKWQLHRICVAVANANGEGTSEPSRRLMDFMASRPLTRNNLYGKMEGDDWFRDLVFANMPKKHQHSSLLGLTHP